MRCKVGQLAFVLEGFNAGRIVTIEKYLGIAPVIWKGEDNWYATVPGSHIWLISGDRPFEYCKVPFKKRFLTTGNQMPMPDERLQPILPPEEVVKYDKLNEIVV